MDSQSPLLEKTYLLTPRDADEAIEFFQKEHGDQQYILVINHTIDHAKFEDWVIPFQRICIAAGNSSAQVRAIKIIRPKSAVPESDCLMYRPLIRMSIPDFEKRNIHLDFENFNLHEVQELGKVKVKIRNLKLYVPSKRNYGCCSLWELNRFVERPEHLTLDNDVPLEVNDLEMLEQWKERGTTVEVVGIRKVRQWGSEAVPAAYQDWPLEEKDNRCSSN